MTAPSPEKLREAINYNPKSGLFFWAASRWKGKVGQPALNTKHAKGYLHGQVLGSQVLAHRAAWAIFYKEDPPEQIDHINGDRADNRIENLRAANAQVNARNRKRPAGKIGKVGVFWDVRERKWRAGIKVDGRAINLGRYDDFSKAVAARLDAERSFGFHANNGRYDKLTPARGK